MQVSVQAENKSKKLKTRLLTTAALMSICTVMAPGKAGATPNCIGGTANGNGGMDYVVSGANTNPCYLSVNDTLVVNSGGSIVTTDEDAVFANDSGISITNAGNIEVVNGDPDAAIHNDGGTILYLGNTGTIKSNSNSSYVGTIYNNAGTINVLNNNGGQIISENNVASAITNVSGSSIGMLTNKGGLISSEGGYGIYSVNSDIYIDNRGGIIESINDYGVYVDDGAITIDNRDGIIRSTNYVGLLIQSNLVDGLLQNEGGLITTSGSTYEALNIYGDLGGTLTVRGGTISNTYADDDAVAIKIEDDQSGTIIFDGVNIIADGATPNSGNGYAIFNYEYDANIELTSTTNVRGNIYLDCCGTMNITTSATMLGDITLDSGDENSVTINGGSITGDVTFNSGNDTLNLNGGVINGNVQMGSGDNLIIVGGDYATNGTIASSGGGAGLYINNDATFTVNNAVNLGSGLISVTDGTLYLSKGNVTSTSVYRNSDTTRIGTGRTLTAASFDSAVSGNLVFDATSNSGALETGSINITSGAANLSNQTVSVMYSGGSLNNGTRSLIAEGSGAASIAGSAVTDNSYLYDFEIEVDNTNEVYLNLAQSKTLEEAANSSNNYNASNALVNEIGTGADSTIDQIISNLGAAGSQKEYNEILESTQPTVDSGNQVAAVGMASAMFDLADGQLAMVNTGGGTPSGDKLKGLHFWTQGFGSTATQDERGGIDGYDADVMGVAFGVDTRNLNKNTVVGLSFGYANTEVDSKNANRTETDVDSYQLMAYGNHDLGGDSFLTGMAIYGWNNNDQTRHDVGGVPGLNANADYDSWTAGARASAGHNFHVNKGGSKSLKLTPQVFTEYVHFKRDGYTESGAGGANITASEASQNIWNVGASMQAEVEFKTANGTTIRPDIHASYKYDVADDAADTTASFAAGGSTFGTDALDPSDSTFGVGAGVKIYTVNNWDFTANYDYTFKSDYDAHSGFLRAAYEF